MLQPEPVCLLIADISGYTEYLTTVEIDHAQDILADLTGTVVTALRPNFRLAKLEGDAAFCFAPAGRIDASVLLDTIERCYFGFRRRRRDVRQATSCACNACTRIPSLNLKFVAHHGLALRQKVAGREELVGADVIAVHRLLKNDIVEKTGVTAYAALTDRLVAQTQIDPPALAMREHEETYEHVGTLKLWVHDLEARWQQEEARQRFYVSDADALFSMSHDVPAPPQVVWEFMTAPGRRMQWQAVGGVTAIDQDLAPGGRRGVGTVNHCMHGPAAIIEQVLDWRPYDYLTDRSTMPGNAFSFVSTFELEPTSSGTRIHFRIASPDRASDRAALEGFGPQMAEGLREGLAVLSRDAAVVAQERATLASEPRLPEPRKRDGFLEGLEPIQIVD